MKAMELKARAADLLADRGLHPLGWLRLEAPDLPPGHEGHAGCAALMIGNHAQDGVHRMWQAFRASSEFRDGAADPLNRWTERVVSAVAHDLNGEALYPFGEPVWPFQRWAGRATGMLASPLGILIHPAHGLWHALRAVLVFKEAKDLPELQKLIHPCHECSDKPCLSSCPVDAFSNNGFAVSSCRKHLSSGREPDCLADGCRARAACPVGIPYDREQIRFHMKAFA